jgi:glucose-6-phosphate 1-dehydrogenase
MSEVKKKNVPTVLVVLGVTGDLMEKKIAYALYKLFTKGKLPKMLKIVGFARRDWKDSDLQKHVVEILERKEIDTKTEEAQQFISRFAYHQGDFDDEEAYNDLAKDLGRTDDEWQACSNKLFYLAVPPQHYKKIFEHLATSGLTESCSDGTGWTRVMVEKPFGSNLKTAKELDGLLAKLFKEVQIFRIDHYLAKEMMQNILAFRFSNEILRPMWNKDHIERIDLRFNETIGAEDRGYFYDGTGALRDVGQNHLLQMLAFITMDHPEKFDSEHVRSNRAKVLKALRVSDETYRAQYEGFQEIPDVKPDSQTETYFRLCTSVNTPNFEGVPIYIEGGKRLAKEQKEIEITFKEPDKCLGGDECEKEHHNKITISFAPTASIKIRFWAKKPGLTFESEPRDFDFLLPKEGDSHFTEGNQILFVSTEEIEAMWAFIDPIVSAWKENVVPLEKYKPYTTP